MKVTKTYPINAEYLAIIEIDNDNLILYIEKVKKIFFGLIDWNERVTCFRVFTMGDKDEDQGIDIQRMIHGYIGRYGLNKRNVDTFDVQIEIAKLYHSYLSVREAKKEKDKKLNALINRL